MSPPQGGSTIVHTASLLYTVRITSSVLDSDWGGGWYHIQYTVTTTQGAARVMAGNLDIFRFLVEGVALVSEKCKNDSNIDTKVIDYKSYLEFIRGG